MKARLGGLLYAIAGIVFLTTCLVPWIQFQPPNIELGENGAWQIEGYDPAAEEAKYTAAAESIAKKSEELMAKGTSEEEINKALESEQAQIKHIQQRISYNEMVNRDITLSSGHISFGPLVVSASVAGQSAGTLAPGGGINPWFGILFSLIALVTGVCLVISGLKTTFMGTGLAKLVGIGSKAMWAGLVLGLLYAYFPSDELAAAVEGYASSGIPFEKGAVSPGLIIYLLAVGFAALGFKLAKNSSGGSEADESTEPEAAV